MEYNRHAVIEYAQQWALKRNPRYYDFEHIGGDCTNFVSQCIFSGARVMNYTPLYGWYYRSLSERTPSWSGVKYLYNFLVNNKSVGPFAYEVEKQAIQPGDVIQLGRSDGHFYHTLIVTEIFPEILVCAHTYDALDRPLSSYDYEVARYLHIDGVREY